MNAVSGSAESEKVSSEICELKELVLGMNENIQELEIMETEQQGKYGDSQLQELPQLREEWSYLRGLLKKHADHAGLTKAVHWYCSSYLTYAKCKSRPKPKEPLYPIPTGNLIDIVGPFPRS